jgi:hypothetical protein
MPAFALSGEVMLGLAPFGVLLIVVILFRKQIGKEFARLLSVTAEGAGIKMRVELAPPSATVELTEAEGTAGDETDAAPQEHREIGEADQTEPDWTQRHLLARALSAAYQEGLGWYRRDVDTSDWERWQKRTWTLIFAALGQGEATCFLSDWRSGEQTLSGLDARLQWLADLIGRVDSVVPLTLRSDFDGKDWV